MNNTDESIQKSCGAWNFRYKQEFPLNSPKDDWYIQLMNVQQELICYLRFYCSKINVLESLSKITKYMKTNNQSKKSSAEIMVINDEEDKHFLKDMLRTLKKKRQKACDIEENNISPGH